MTGFFLAISLFIQVHGWYDSWCCNDTDCRPVACEELTEDSNGVRYKEFLIPKEHVKPSKDNQCHVCIFQGKGRCAYIQMNT